MIAIESDILAHIPLEIQNQVQNLSETKQQIFAYIFTQSIQYTETFELTTNIQDIAEDTLFEILNPKSKAHNAISLSQYKLNVLNQKIDRAILQIHGFKPPFPIATTITEAEIILEQFHHLFIKQQEKEISDFIEACSTFEGREAVRVQYEEWELDQNKINPIPNGYTVPQETDPYAQQIAKERHIQRCFNRETQTEEPEETFASIE